jgi:hypothetical protein
MDPKFQSSFIPKGPIPMSGSFSSVDHRGDRSLFGFLSIVIFVITVLLSGGVFAYKLYLNSQISQMGSDLTAADATLDPTSINEMSNLSARIKSTEDLLAHHVVLSPLFSYLETSTIQSVELTDFSYSVDDTGALNLVLDGQGSGYGAVALQANVFDQSPYLKNIVFSNLVLNDKGAVTFTLSATVDPTLVSYEKEIQGVAVVPTISTPAPLVVSSSTPKTTAIATASTTTN